MENVADALKIAAAVIIFIIAISSSFSLFGTAKQTADSIIGMRDSQKYLEATELDTVLYTSSESIENTGSGDVWSGTGITKNGDRIVDMSDVISTIYRYNKEKYGVTIVESNGTVISRYDSNTEAIMNQYNNIESGFTEYETKLEENTNNKYCNPNFRGNLANLFKVEITGGSNGINCGAPWYGNDDEIKKRISADISGEEYSYNNQIYDGGEKNLSNLLSRATKIIEVTNEIDNSEYLEDEATSTSTNLMKQYQLPTVEIIYIIYD